MRRSTWRGALALVVLAVVAVGVAVIARDDGSSPTVATTTTTEPSRLQEAVLRADVRVEGIDAADVGALIEELCGSRDGEAVASRVVALGLTEPVEVQALVEGVGRGAMSFCPAVAAEEPQLVNDAYNAVLAQLEQADEP